MAISTAVDASAVARVVGIQTKFINTNVGGVVFLPQRIAVVGQGSTSATYSTDKFTISSAAEAGTLYGFGSPLHLAALQLLPPNGDGVRSVPVTMYPLVDDGAGVAAAGDVTPSGTATKAGTFRAVVNDAVSVQFTLSAGDTVADATAALTDAINATLDLPVVAVDGATVVDITSKWKGASANGLLLAIDGPTDIGITWAITQPTGGAGNPDVNDALEQVGDVWETLILNCMDIDDDITLDAFETFGEGRWGSLTRKPCVVLTGHTYEKPDGILAITDLRKTDRINCALPNPASSALPFVSAAGQLARIAVTANNNPARDYARGVAKYVPPGPDGVQWNYAQRDQAVKGGASTIEVRDGEVNISDVVTMYHPDGDPIPAYRYVCDIVKEMNVIFNLDLIFNTAAWDGAPLIPDDQPTVNPDAKKPKDARAALSTLAYNLGLNALISDIVYTQENLQAEISDQNPKRLDCVFPHKLSGNANIISIDNNFGFYFGSSAVRV